MRVTITQSLKGKRGYVSFIHLQWGDLDKKIGRGEGGKKSYSDWAGKVVARGALVERVTGIAFDDKKGKTAKEGSGADQILSEKQQQVTWASGVVGATDGLVIRLISPKATISGEITAGKFTIPFSITPLKAGTLLPNGATSH